MTRKTSAISQTNLCIYTAWSRGYKHFSCSTQLIMKFFLLINVKMPTIVGILTFMSRKNSIPCLSEIKKKLNFLIFLIVLLCAFKIACSSELSMRKNYNRGRGGGGGGRDQSFCCSQTLRNLRKQKLTLCLESTILQTGLLSLLSLLFANTLATLLHNPLTNSPI